MTVARPAFERRVLSALEADPAEKANFCGPTVDFDKDPPKR